MHAPLLALLLFAAGPEPAATESLADLLVRVAESEERVMALYETGSFKVSTTYKSLDAGGKAKSTSVADTRLFQKDGKPWEEITHFVDDGEDVTARENEKRQKALESGKRKRKDGLPFASPFAKDQQALYEFTDRGADPADPARRRIAFKPKEKSETTYKGEGLVDSSSAALVRLAMRPTVYPYFVNRLDVVMEVESPTEAGPALSALRVSATGQVLFIKKHIEVEALFSDYVLAPTP